jgi:hypothetical protein
VTAAPRRVRTRDRWLLCLLAVVFAGSVGLWQTQAILQFRRPAVDLSVAPGERAEVEGVAYGLSGFTHAPDLPIAPSLQDAGDDSDDLVTAIGGAELVLVVLTVELRDPARDPKTVFCDVTLHDPAGRTWRTDSTVDYKVDKPAAVSCTGSLEGKPRVGVPFEVGLVFQVPAAVADQVTVRLRLSGGQQRQVLELRPR